MWWSDNLYTIYCHTVLLTCSGCFIKSLYLYLYIKAWFLIFFMHYTSIIIIISFHFPMLLSISFIKIIYLCLRKKSWFNNISEETEKTLFVIITSGFLKHLCDVLKSFCKTFNLLKSSVKLKANLCSRVQSHSFPTLE